MLSVSCVSWYPQPSSITCGGPAGASVPVLDRDEQKIRRGADPHAAEPDLDAADEVQVLDEHLPAVEASVAVGVLEDQNPILALAFRRAHGIRVAFGNPQPAAVVEREGNRPHDVRLGCGELDGEALRHGHGAAAASGRQARVRDRIHRRHRRSSPSA